MINLILEFLYAITTFFQNIIPDIPDISAVFSGNTVIYDIASALGYWTNHNQYITALIEAVFYSYIILLLSKVFRFIIRLIPTMNA